MKYILFSLTACFLLIQKLISPSTQKHDSILHVMLARLSSLKFTNTLLQQTEEYNYCSKTGTSQTVVKRITIGATKMCVEGNVSHCQKFLFVSLQYEWNHMISFFLIQPPLTQWNPKLRQVPLLQEPLQMHK